MQHPVPHTTPDDWTTKGSSGLSRSCSIQLMWLHSLVFMYDHVAVQPCGCVALWLCRHVAMQTCGCVEMWLCSHVAVLQCACVARLQCSCSAVLPCGDVCMRLYKYVDVQLCGCLASGHVAAQPFDLVQGLGSSEIKQLKQVSLKVDIHLGLQ